MTDEKTVRIEVTKEELRALCHCLGKETWELGVLAIGPFGTPFVHTRLESLVSLEKYLVEKSGEFKS